MTGAHLPILLNGATSPAWNVFRRSHWRSTRSHFVGNQLQRCNPMPALSLHPTSRSILAPLLSTLLRFRTQKVPCIRGVMQVRPHDHDTAAIGLSNEWAGGIHCTGAATTAYARQLGGQILRNRTSVCPRAAKATVYHAVHGEGAWFQGHVRSTTLIFICPKLHAVSVNERNVSRRMPLTLISFVYLVSRCTRNVSPNGAFRRTSDAQREMVRF